MFFWNLRKTIYCTNYGIYRGLGNDGRSKFTVTSNTFKLSQRFIEEIQICRRCRNCQPLLCHSKIWLMDTVSLRLPNTIAFRNYYFKSAIIPIISFSIAISTAIASTIAFSITPSPTISTIAGILFFFFITVSEKKILSKTLPLNFCFFCFLFF